MEFEHLPYFLLEVPLLCQNEKSVLSLYCILSLFFVLLQKKNTHQGLVYLQQMPQGHLLLYENQNIQIKKTSDEIINTFINQCS
jgi:hypothetical protein